MELRKRNFSTAFCSNGSNFIHCFAHFQNAFFTCCSNRIFKTHFFAFFTFVHKSVKNMWKNAFWKCGRKKCEKKSVLKMHLGKNVKKCEKREKNWKSSWGGGTLILFLQVWFFGVQFCCNYFAAGPTSAGWKSERSSSNRSEVDCADRRSV